MNMPSSTGNGSEVLPQAPRAGVGLHFASLPSPFGIGDIGDASLKFIDALEEMNLRVWQFLPTGPTAYGDSPYQPLSAFAGNENLIGVEPLIRNGLLEKHEAEPLRALPKDTVDYGALIPIKSKILKTAAARFSQRAGTDLKQEYQAFLEATEAHWLADYALYRILKQQHQERPWTDWDRDCVRRDSATLKRVSLDHAEAVEHIKVLQFLFDTQWRKLKSYAGSRQIRLFGDMPIYIALDSADAWAHPEMLLINQDGKPSHVAGVPPDYFSEDGQLWGNPLYDWEYHEANGYQWWVDRVAHAAQMNDLVRIDHFRGFESYWSVPFEETTARQGQWVPGPRDGLFKAMEHSLGALPIVAEDLGVITEEVDALRRRHHIPGMVVLQFDVSDPAFDPDAIDQHSICYTGTHDNDTTVGWFLGGGDDTRDEGEVLQTREYALSLTGGSAETIHLDMIRLAFRTPAQIAIAPMQDFLGLGSAARLNIPGTTLNNWRWRLEAEDLTPQFRAGVRLLVEAGGRG